MAIWDDDLAEREETFRVQLLRVIGGARLGEMTSVTISIPPNDSPLGRFGFQELGVGFLRCFYSCVGFSCHQR